jgi:hypothetical protein
MDILLRFQPVAEDAVYAAAAEDIRHQQIAAATG